MTALRRWALPEHPPAMTPETRLTPPPEEDLIHFPVRQPPMLSVVVDTEEEFDWGTFSPDAVGVSNIAAQQTLHPLFERYGMVPTYAIDYPVASQPDGCRPLIELLQSGSCEIGVHLHPWVNPPFMEMPSAMNSFPGNLPLALEFAKLAHLTECIRENFGISPYLYRAGRYGFGVNTPESMKELGIEIDCSVLPRVDLQPRFGPNYLEFEATPFWMGGAQDGILELPVTVGLTGLLPELGLAHPLLPLLTDPMAQRLHLPGLLARLGMLNRVPLSPEGVPVNEAKQATRALLRRGQRFFCIAYHSPSLAIGHTSYVRNRQDLDRFHGWMEDYMDFFFGELGGVAVTPGQVLRQARRLQLGGINAPVLGAAHG